MHTITSGRRDGKTSNASSWSQTPGRHIRFDTLNSEKLYWNNNAQVSGILQKTASQILGDDPSLFQGFLPASGEKSPKSLSCGIKTDDRKKDPFQEQSEWNQWIVELYHHRRKNMIKSQILGEIGGIANIQGLETLETSLNPHKTILLSPKERKALDKFRTF